MTHPLDLKEFTLPELEQLMAAWGQPNFRARQLVKWLYKGVGAFEDMTDIARPFRAELSRRARISKLHVEQVQAAADGCRKFLFALEDGNLIESVLIPEEGHYTLCLSTQVGCAQGCRFCLTARRGLIRNLTAGEIVNQVLAVRRELADGLPLTNLVFMGMGEPLANFAHLVRGRVERFHLPGIAGINFMLHEALDGGGPASMRMDPLGKGMAQMLLELPIRIPQSLAAGL